MANDTTMYCIILGEKTTLYMYMQFYESVMPPLTLDNERN